MRDTQYRFEILPKRLRLHLPEQKLLTPKDGAALGGGNGSKPDSSRAFPQQHFMRKIKTVSRPHFEDKNIVKVKSLAVTATRFGLAFGSGAMFGVLAQRRGWMGLSRGMP